jgi:hypothetical protein
MNERDDLIDETVLRRSLRFEADERAPRFDVAAIAAMAGAEQPLRRTMLVVLAAVALTGALGGAVWSAIVEHATEIASVVTDGLLDALITVVTLLVPVAEAASEPAVPLSLFAALGVAIVHELRERRENVHVHAS